MVSPTDDTTTGFALRLSIMVGVVFTILGISAAIAAASSIPSHTVELSLSAAVIGVLINKLLVDR